MLTKDSLIPTRDALACVPARLASRYHTLPLSIAADGALHIALDDPTAFDLLDELRLVVRRSLHVELASREAIDEAIREHYGIGAETLDALVDSRGIQTELTAEESGAEEFASDASIIKFVNQLVQDGYTSRATDIHIEPFEGLLRIRYRIDGMLVDAAMPESIRHFRDSITSRIKIMANLDIAERRKPQDGRIQLRIGSRQVDLRVSVIPVSQGEAISLRILQRSNVMLGLGRIGYDEQAQTAIDEMLRRPNGIMLLTGPTGSGKTTTLYACLQRINDTHRKIITIEDPIEYEIHGICQMQVRPEIGFTFASGLRCMLRHDPDVMLVGEVRDLETAELAIRCALTGHLVFSTLHTNDAPGAIPRLADIGIEPFLLASSIEAVVGQRLVRIVCPECARPAPSTQVLLDRLGTITGNEAEASYVEAVGCAQCRNTGYWGRTAIYELMVINEELRQLTIQRSPASHLHRAATDSGMTPIKTCGLRLAQRGATTLEEVLRVL